MSTDCVVERRGEIIIEQKGKTCEVPDYPIAHIMYYLSCVNSCININLSSKLTNYDNHRNLSFDDTNEILKLAKYFSPSYMKEKGIFIDNSDLAGDSLNEFYKITSKEANVIATIESFCASGRIHIEEKMAYKTEWVNNHYYNPIQKFSDRIRAIENGTIEKLRPRTHSYKGPEKPIALLMYYLSCVNDLIDFKIPNGLINYQNYQNLSNEQINQILSFVLLFEPNFFIEKNLMINDLLVCGKYTNKFYNIYEMMHKKPTSEFKFADRIIHSRKVMIFDEKWIQDFYYTPTKSENARLKKFKNGSINSDRSCIIQ